MPSIRELEKERIERMIRVLKMPTKKKYSARQKAVDLITIAELERKLHQLKYLTSNYSPNEINKDQDGEREAIHSTSENPVQKGVPVHQDRARA